MRRVLTLRLLGILTGWTLLFLLALTAQAATSVFGPKQYVRTTGQPNTFTESFAVCQL